MAKLFILAAMIATTASLPAAAGGLSDLPKFGAMATAVSQVALHFLLNHAPLFATMFGLGLLTYGLLYKSNHEDTIEISRSCEALIDAHDNAATVSLITPRPW